MSAVKYTLDVMQRIAPTQSKWNVIRKIPVAKAEDDKWFCRCACGTERVVTGYSIRTGISRNCGCGRAALLRKKFTKHRMVGTPEYIAWSNMKRRCYTENVPEYQDYGARGITVASEWRNDFLAFYNHIGPRPSHNYSLDRIKVNGNYEPGNVRWATSTVQNANRRKQARIDQFTDEELQSELSNRLRKRAPHFSIARASKFQKAKDELTKAAA